MAGAAFDIVQSLERSQAAPFRLRRRVYADGVDSSAIENAANNMVTLNGEDFLFLGRQQLIDLRNGAIGSLLHIGGKTGLIILGYFVVFL
jgi:hypothetical protein